jgi:hypothetical protein
LIENQTMNQVILKNTIGKGAGNSTIIGVIAVMIRAKILQIPNAVAAYIAGKILAVSRYIIQ